jgi:PAT family beta-lactamase induction signal transducer AmpG
MTGLNAQPPQNNISNIPSVQTSSKLSWLSIIKTYTQWRTLRMLGLGFSAGLPLLLILGTLSFWLKRSRY